MLLSGQLETKIPTQNLASLARCSGRAARPDQCAAVAPEDLEHPKHKSGFQWRQRTEMKHRVLLLG